MGSEEQNLLETETIQIMTTLQFDCSLTPIILKTTRAGDHSPLRTDPEP